VLEDFDLGAESPVKMDLHDRVAVVSLNAPDRLNVFSAEMGDRLSSAYKLCDERDDIRVVVLTASGRAFCAGADMTSESSTFASAGATFSAQPLDPPAWELRKPVIAAVQGHAIGIGFTLAMQCDMRIVAAEAKLAIPQVRRGVLGDAGSHWTVRHFASSGVAADVLLSGRTFLGQEAVQMGLASQALPPDEVLPAALNRAQDIAKNCAPVSLALTKRLLWSDLDLRRTLELETAYHRVVMGTSDAREGPRAWSEHRDPDWTGSISDSWDLILSSERDGPMDRQAPSF
jgi:enoyl-CoA hydratase/carnithine racemase